MPTVKLPDGTRLNFPDGMSEEEMASAIDANFPQFASPKTQPKQPDALDQEMLKYREGKPAPERSWSEAFGDSARSLTQGLLDIASVPGVAYGAATGNYDNALLRTTRGINEVIDDQMSPAMQARRQELARKQAAAEGWQEKLGVGLVETISDPALLANTALRSLPGMGASGVAGRVAGGVAGRMAGTTATVAPSVAGKVTQGYTVSSAAPQVAARVGGATAVGTGAVQQGASVAADTYDEAMKIPLDLLRQDPEFQTLAEQVGEEEAQQRMAADAANRAGAVATAASLAAMKMVPGGSTIEKAFLPAAMRETAEAGSTFLTRPLTKGMAGGFGSKAAELAVVGGAKGAQESLSEGVEEGAGAAAKALEMSRLGKDVNVEEEAAAAAGQAMPVGFALGGGVQTVQTLRAPRVEEQPTVPVAPPVTPAAADPRSVAQKIKEAEGGPTDTGAAPAAADPAAQARADSRLAAVDAALAQQAAVPGATQPTANVPAAPVAQALTNPQPAIPAATDPRSQLASELAALRQRAEQQAAQQEAQRVKAEAEAAAKTASTGSNYQQKDATPVSMAGAVPNPQTVDALVNAARGTAAQYADIRNPEVYSEPVLYGIINHPNVGPEMLSMARTELARRRGTIQAPNVSTNTSITGIPGSTGTRVAGAQGANTGVAPAGAQGIGNTVSGEVNGGQPVQSAKPAQGSGAGATASRLTTAPTAAAVSVNAARSALRKYRNVTARPATGPLTPGQSLASTLANLFGRTFTVMERLYGPKDDMPNGFIMPGTNDIYVDKASNDAPLFVTVHEIWHTLPDHIRKKANDAIRALFDSSKEGEFGREFGVSQSELGEEIPAYMAQAISKREDFWQQLRAKMGNSDFMQFAEEVLRQFKRILGMASESTGQAFLDKYVGDETKILKARDLLIDAYVEAAREQGVQPDAGLVGQGIQASQKPADFADPEDRLTVSTAQPTAKPDRKTGYQPSSYSEKRVIDAEDIKVSVKHVDAIVQALRKYNSLSGKGRAAQVLQELHQTVVDNLLWLHDHVTPEARERAKLWYDGANRIAKDWTDKFGLNLRQTGGILAVFSPQTDWFKNVSLAERAITILRDHGNEKWSEGMTKWSESWLNSSTTVATKASRLAIVKKMRNIADGGKTLSELAPEDAAYFIRAFDEAYFPRSYRLVTPEGGFGDYVTNATALESENEAEEGSTADEASIAWGGYGTIEKAVKIYRDGSFRTVDTELGGEHKVRNFYNNIVDPNSADGHVTIDTHAVAAAFVKALSGNSEEVKHNLGGLGSTAATGASGSYALFADAYRDAAAQRGILAREMQSITWEAVRSLFPASLKKGMSDKVSAVWDLVKSGDLSREEARAEVLRLSREAGGDKPFAWANSGAGAFAAEGGLSFDPVVAENPADREVRTLEPKTAKDKVSVSLSAATNTIPGIKALYDMAQKGDQAAHALLQDVARDSLQHLLSGTSASIKFEPATGLYGGASEPSMSLTVSFADEDRAAVLAALARFADNFNQEQIHVRQGTSEKKMVKYEDGSYITPVYRWALKKALDRKAIQKVIDKSGLYGLTFGNGFVEAYFVGDTENVADIDAFFENAGRADSLLGSSGATLSESRARLWPYGYGDGAIGYGNIRGDVTPGQATSSKTARRVAEFLRGEKVKSFDQAPEITQEQAALQREIAQVYESLPDNDLKNKLVRKAYAELAKEAVRQYKALPIKVEVMTGNGEPYPNSDAMRRDLLDNNHLYVFGTTPETFGPPGEDFSGHPLLQPAGVTDAKGYPMLANDVLRAVHDYYAHAMSPTQFGPKGEEAAWKNHMSMTGNPWARWALTSETRGQNSWVNFNQNLDPQTAIKDRPFARQKAVLLPVKYSLTGHGPTDKAMKEFIKTLSPKDQEGTPPAFSNKAQDLDQDIVLTFPVEGGKTAKMTVNAKTYLDQLSKREDALRMVKECLA